MDLRALRAGWMPAPTKNSNLETPWKLNFLTEFRLAAASEPEQTSDETGVNKWTSGNERTTVTALNQPAGKSGVYRPLVDQGEIRVLELRRGVGDDILRGRLHHCLVEYDLSPELAEREGCIHPSKAGPNIIPDLTRFAVSKQGPVTKALRYTALSYAWGPPVFEGSIWCEGQALPITRSLDIALRHLRQPDCSVFLWIDQICINQEDREEKSKQIPLMSKIYERALSTVIWLGPSTPGSDSVIRFLHDLSSDSGFSEPNVDPVEFESRGLPPADSETWRELWDFFSRSWFTRTWIIQEAVLSADPWIVCGYSCLPWDALKFACLKLEESGISRWVREKFRRLGITDNDETGWHRGVVERVTGIENTKASYNITSLPDRKLPSLFHLLIYTRSAASTDPRDKVYALLGMCDYDDRAVIHPSYAEDCTAAKQYHTVAVSFIERSRFGSDLSHVLTAIDHEPSANLPSWVPDWRQPRRTVSLGQKNIELGAYNAAGWPSGFRCPEVPPAKLKGKEKEELCVPGLVVDTLAEISDVFADVELSYLNPKVENKALVAAADFVSRISGKLRRGEGTVTGVFDAFWNTIVAGKDESEWQRPPIQFKEIISFLLDESSGKSPTLPDQWYSKRQKLPKGRGKLELSSLSRRTLGHAFQNLRIAMKNAMQNRRLGVTKKGHLGLFPRYCKVGDGVCIVDRCHVPLLVRNSGKQGKFILIGESFVYGIMDGEALQEAGTKMGEITFV